MATEPHPPTYDEEPRWHAALVVIVTLILYVMLPTRLEFGPTWIFPTLVLGVLIPLLVMVPSRHLKVRLQRVLSIALIGTVNLFNLISVVRLVWDILEAVHPAGYRAPNGRELLIAGGEIWVTNLLVYALWFWELDAGGPEPRSHQKCATDFSDADFLFPQMLMGDRGVAAIDATWKPRLFDYIFLAFCTALAFSPADVMPLSRTAKFLMLAEASMSFVTIAVILARAVGMT